MSKNYFKTGSNYGNISIRDEFVDLLLGDDLGSPNGVPFLIEMPRMVIGTNIPLKCDCVDRFTKEPDRDYPCPKCKGSGYIHDDMVIYGWKMRALRSIERDEPTRVGVAGQHSYTFYLKYDEKIGRIDKIYDLRMDKDGNVINPIQRIASYKIMSVDYIRLDNSRIEFIAITASVADGVGLNSGREVL